MGKFEKKPDNEINWPQTFVNFISGLLIGIILMILDWVFK